MAAGQKKVPAQMAIVALSWATAILAIAMTTSIVRREARG
jgi:hypothetical protein